MNTEAGRAELLKQVLQDLEVQNAVLVSPSLSGSYALPFLMQRHHQLRGFVPIAPTSTRNYTRDQFRAVKVLSELQRCWHPLPVPVACITCCVWGGPRGSALAGSVGTRLLEGITCGLDPHRNPGPTTSDLTPCRPQLLSCTGNWTTPWREYHCSSSTTCPTTLW